MRTILTASLMLALPALVFGQEPCGDHPACGHGKAALLRMRPPVPRLAGERDADTDAQHYLLDIELDPATQWIGGSNTMTVRSQVDGLTQFFFRLDQTAFTITAVNVAGQPAPWQWLADQITVQVSLDRPYNVDEIFTVYVAYNGHPQTGGLGSFTFRYRSGAPEAYSLSEPWYAYTWWPAKDDLRDKTTADLWFTVPNTMVVGSNGLLQGVDIVPPNKVRHRWLTNYQTADYLYSVATTNYHEFGSTWTYGSETMPLQFYIYPEDDTPAHRQFWNGISSALTVFSDLFGAYPFINEKYGMAEFGWGGGMEHQTLTSIGGYFTWESGIVHELSHQWWGDNVTCATWHDIWLNEGFADYCEALWYEHKPGGNEAALHSAMADRRPWDVNGTVYCFDDSDPDRVFDYNLTYLKAGWVVHMFRHVLGDSNFYALLDTYRATYEGGAATTADLQALAEAVAGRELGWFFQTWVYGVGAPDYRYAWRQFVLDGIRYIELYVKQVQSASYPVYTMPIDIQVTQLVGNTTYVVWNDAQAEHLLFSVGTAQVSTLAFDPKPWILRTGGSTITFVEGPPKIVTMDPAPDAIRPAAGVNTLEVVFHKAVTAAAGDLSLVGVRSGVLPVSFAYDAGRYAVTLTPATPLATDTYTLTVSDSIHDVAANKALDGELVKPNGPNPLPSGDGLPGGSAIAQFRLTRVADTDCSGTIDFDDIDPFVLALADAEGYAAQYPGCPLANADASHDGLVNFDDINPFVECLSGGSCE